MGLCASKIGTVGTIVGQASSLSFDLAGWKPAPRTLNQQRTRNRNAGTESSAKDNGRIFGSAGNVVCHPRDGAWDCLDGSQRSLWLPATLGLQQFLRLLAVGGPDHRRRTILVLDDLAPVCGDLGRDDRDGRRGFWATDSAGYQE